MNNKFLSLAAAAATMLAFAACNKDDVQNPNAIPSDMTTAYAKVTISMPSVTGTRAATSETTSNSSDPQFDAGTADEQSISNIFLALYDDFGNYVGIGKPYSDIKVSEEQGKNWNEKTESSNNGNISNSITHVFKLDLIGENDPTQVVAFINFNEEEIDRSHLATLVSGKAFEGNLHDKEKDFVMTNAGYYNKDDGTGEFLVAEKLGKIFHTEKEAQDALEAEKAVIFVERLAAKVSVKNGLTTTSQDDLNFIVEDVLGETVNLNFVPTYWGVTGKATSEYYVKTPFKEHLTWNSATNHRSFWAEGVNYNKVFTEYYKNQETSGLLDYIKYIYKNNALQTKDMGLLDFPTANSQNAQYVREHTSNLQNVQGEEIIANTYALVIGNYTLDGGTNVNWFKRTSSENFDFYLLLKEERTVEGKQKKVFTIYSKSQLIGYLLHWNGATTVKVKGADTEYTTLPTDKNFFDGTNEKINFASYLDLQYVDGKYKLIPLTGASTLTYMKDQTETEITATELSDNFKKSTNARNYHYDAGSAYFNVPIAHDKTIDTTYGVVRNHSYVLNINKIENLGAPLNGDVFNPDPENPDPIIPDPDDFQENFINAQINVLSWHAINNDVTL